MVTIVKKSHLKLKKIILISFAVIAVIILSAIGYYVWINQNPRLNQVYTDITYKITAEQELKLDMYMPTRQLWRKTPIMVFFHGGGWDSGSRQLGASDMETFGIFRELGFAIVSVEYRLTNEQLKFPIPFADAADSLRWLHQHAADYGLDLNKINLIGTSAGGQMALLTGLTGNEFRDDPELKHIVFPVRSIVSLCGPTDLTDLSGYPSEQHREEAAKLLERVIGGSGEEMPEQYIAASPINHIQRDSPPILISHGTLDDIVPFRQAEKFVEEGQRVGAPVTFIPVENADHKFKAPRGETTYPLVEDALRQIALFLLKKNAF